MEKVIHKAHTRGFADHGWLKSHHTFSFARYFDEQRMNFGLLRVLNDDIVEPGRGFGTHAHDNMEIISIPLQGVLAHKDDQGHEQMLRPDEVQIMSAGTGIKHSEYNYSKVERVNFLQIWIFPRERNIQPRYEQKEFDARQRINTWQTLVSAEKSGDHLWINQDACISRIQIEPSVECSYKRRSDKNGLYVFVIEGNLETAGEHLQRRDGMCIWDVEQLLFRTEVGADVLLLEVPME